ncbi:ribonuclease H protein, partial [Trifolium medium]|nr:ribonuclease H protein [Trifolium medium]
DENVERILVDYFTEMFTSSDPLEVDKTCEVVAGKLNDDQVRWFSQPFAREEVEEAILQMHPLKAPGPDGLPTLFYQKYWKIVGTEVCMRVLDILNNSTSPESVNNTHIVLILKCKNPNSPKDFRPISLCNVIIKIVTKTIANRIKPILPEIIDEEQSVLLVVDL